MEIRDAVDSDWAAIWGFLRQIVVAGDTYCWPPDTTEDAARTWWRGKSGGRVFVAVEDGAVVGSAELHANQPGRGVMSPMQASWCRRLRPAGVLDVPLLSASSKSRRTMATRRCSSMLSSRPTSTQYGCGSRSVSRFSPPFRKRSNILTVG